MVDKGPGGSPPNGGINSGKMPLPRFILVILAAAIVGYLVSGGYREWRQGREQAVREFSTMHTTGRIIVPAGSGAKAGNLKAAELAEKAVQEVAALMGPVGANSDIRKLNEASPGVWVEVSPLTWQVVMESMRWHRLSGGVFDPTIGPIKQLFKFTNRKLDSWPDAQILAEAKARVGLENLLFDREGMRLSWKKAGMKLDLGAIAKGFSVDRAVAALKEQGVKSALVDIGGEMFLVGKKTDELHSLWKAGVKNPRGNNILDVLEKSDVAIATSGDYEQFFVYDGKRYSHIINPKVGLPMSGGAASVTVIHPSSCMTADALATTLSVLGPEGTRKLLDEQALGAFSQGIEIIMYTLDPDDKLKRFRFTVDKSGKVLETAE